jgi:Flp pilus assembly protein TadG
MMKSYPSHRRKASRGSLVVEGVIAIIVLVMLTFAIIQYAIIQNAEVTVQYYAKEGSRYAAVHNTDSAFGVSSLDTYLQNTIATTNQTVPYSSLTVSYYAPGTKLDNGTTPPSNTLTVEVEYNLGNKVLLSPFVPGMSNFVNHPYTYYSTTFAEGQ